MTVVITYHAVEEGPAPLCLAPDRFRAQLDVLEDLGVETLTVSQLADSLATGTLPARAVCLTFDDGMASAVRTALPMLTERGLTATVFCVAGHLGCRNDWPSQPASSPTLELAGADEILRAHRHGFEIGAHGVEHVPLDTAAPELAGRELTDGKAKLEAIVGTPVRSLAFPYGAEPSAAAAGLVTELYDAACTTRPARVRPGDDPLALPRVDACYLDRPAVLRRAVSGQLDWYLHARGALTALRRRSMP